MVHHRALFPPFRVIIGDTRPENNAETRALPVYHLVNLSKKVQFTERLFNGGSLFLSVFLSFFLSLLALFAQMKYTRHRVEVLMKPHTL